MNNLELLATFKLWTDYYFPILMFVFCLIGILIINIIQFIAEKIIEKGKKEHDKRRNIN